MMTPKQEATLRLALEALESCTPGDYSTGHVISPSYDEAGVEAAITAIREALAEQPAQQEPVAVVSGYYGGQCVVLPTNPARIFNRGTAFYTSPPNVPTARASQSRSDVKPWVGLNESELTKCIAEAGCLGVVKMSFESGPYDIDRPSINASKLLDAIEAKLREKNT